MAKFFGTIGYSITTETRPDIWEEQIVTKPYYGELLRNIRRFETSDNINDDLNISNELSIVADPFAYKNFSAMRYVDFMGNKWKITSVDVQYPRLILTIGGLYNG